MSVASLEHHFVRANGLRFHVVQAGPADGPVALALHGFPEFWRAWAGQIDALVAAGYRVWVPDQRGYGTSDKPEGIAAYGIETLADDVCALIRATGRARVHLLGHDWGGAVSWRVAMRNPELVERLVVVNLPHPAVMFRFMRRGRQLLRSWYIHFFRIPRLPEAMLGAWNHRALVRALVNTSRPGAFTPGELVRYREAWARPGALRAMLNWYRALMRERGQFDPAVRVRVPTLLLWGERDHALGAEMAQPSIEWCDQGELHRLPEATHWVLHEMPATVNPLIVDYLGRGARRSVVATGQAPVVPEALPVDP